jgi:hypothetical protein
MFLRDQLSANAQPRRRVHSFPNSAWLAPVQKSTLITIGALTLPSSGAWSIPSRAADAQLVACENFVRAKTDRMFRDIAALSGGANRFHRIGMPTPLVR